MPKSASGWHRKRTTAADLTRKREYNSTAYKRARTAVKRQVDAGEAYCWRPSCRRWIAPGSAWHLGHDDNDRTIIRGAECPPCNLKAAASKGARIANAHRNQRRWTTSRNW